MEESFAMNGGAGPTSYTHNSKFQKTQMEQAKALLVDSIYQNLVPMPNLSNPCHHVFRIADLGCSVGPNTFGCVQTIIEALLSKYKLQDLEFQVFFNDQVNNDFNTLFLNLPPNRMYHVAGAPGSFHARLFPRASMDIFHSGYALHWLTRVPGDVKNPESPLWNKGRITYAESRPLEVAEAFKAQFRRDIRSFLEARSVEMADGGLMAMLMPCRKEGSATPDSTLLKGFECIGHALMDMVEEGLVEEELVDSFNLPIFIPSPSEVAEATSEVEDLSVEIIKEIHSPSPLSTPQHIAICSSNLRAVFENILSRHFGSVSTNAIFEKLPQKLEKFSKTPGFISSQQVENLFMLIKKTAVSV